VHPLSIFEGKIPSGDDVKDRPSIRLERILGVRHAVDGSSHLCSVADVILGARAGERGGRQGDVSDTHADDVEREGRDKMYVRECGLLLRPKAIK
jgi:hypothetical protein